MPPSIKSSKDRTQNKDDNEKSRTHHLVGEQKSVNTNQQTYSCNSTLQLIRTSDFNVDKLIIDKDKVSSTLLQLSEKKDILDI